MLLCCFAFVDSIQVYFIVDDWKRIYNQYIVNLREGYLVVNLTAKATYLDIPHRKY